MNSFIYTARDIRTGQKIQAEVQAENEGAAARLLTDRGLAPLEIKPKKEASSHLSIMRRIPVKHKVIFSRQLSTLINAGLPLVQSLNTVINQTPDKKLKDVLHKVVSDLESGLSFAQALSKHGDVFDDVYISLIAAGEASGTLDVALERLANQQEKDAEIMAKVRGALVYPILVIVVLVGVVVFMLTTVLPQVQALYTGLPGAKLPFVTSLLLSLSNFMQKFWWILLLGTVGGLFLTFKWARSASGKPVVDRLKMRAPVIGPLFMKVYMARFSRTAATLIGSGVPMIKMLNTTAQAVGNVHVAAAITASIEQVKGGKTLSASLTGNPNFLDLVPNMINIGEQSGAMDGMLTKLADYYEKEVDNQIKSISTVIEPALMVFVGIIALVVVAAILLPIYSLAGKNLIQR